MASNSSGSTLSRMSMSRFIGQINNTLHSDMTLKRGDTVSFVRNEIVDWMYMAGGAMKGNFSAAPSSSRRNRRTARPSCAGSASISISDALSSRLHGRLAGDGNPCLLHPFVAGATAPESDNVIGAPFALAGVSHGGSYVRDRRT